MLLTPQGLSSAYDFQKGRVQRLLMPLLMPLFSSCPQKTPETEHALDLLDRATPKPFRAMRRRHQNLPFLLINQRRVFRYTREGRTPLTVVAGPLKKSPLLIWRKG